MLSKVLGVVLFSAIVGCKTVDQPQSNSLASSNTTPSLYCPVEGSSESLTYRGGDIDHENESDTYGECWWNSTFCYNGSPSKAADLASEMFTQMYDGDMGMEDPVVNGDKVSIGYYTEADTTYQLNIDRCVGNHEENGGGSNRVSAPKRCGSNPKYTSGGYCYAFKKQKHVRVQDACCQASGGPAPIRGKQVAYCIDGSRYFKIYKTNGKLTGQFMSFNPPLKNFDCEVKGKGYKCYEQTGQRPFEEVFLARGADGKGMAWFGVVNSRNEVGEESGTFTLSCDKFSGLKK